MTHPANPPPDEFDEWLQNVDVSLTAVVSSHVDVDVLLQAIKERGERRRASIELSTILSALRGMTTDAPEVLRRATANTLRRYLERNRFYRSDAVRTLLAAHPEARVMVGRGASVGAVGMVGHVAAVAVVAASRVVSELAIRRVIRHLERGGSFGHSVRSR